MLTNNNKFLKSTSQSWAASCHDHVKVTDLTTAGDSVLTRYSEFKQVYHAHASGSPTTSNLIPGIVHGHSLHTNRYQRVKK
jgi:hypothetical protein